MSDAMVTGTDFAARQHRFIRLGWMVCLIFLSLVIVSAAVVRIGGAVTAMGVVVKTGENKPVQHPEGGPVRAIHVADGDRVEVGDRLLTLDAASVEAQHQLLYRQRFELKARLARLDAIVHDVAEPDLPAIDGTFPEAEAQRILATQRELLDATRNRVRNDTTRLRSRITGLRTELTANRAQLVSAHAELDLLDEEIAEISVLVADQLVSKARLTALQREQASLQGRIDALQLSIERARNALKDAEFDLKALDRQTQDDVWQEIEASQAQLEEVERSLDATTDRRDRLQILAPASGRIHELSVNTTNAVVSPGAVIMQIVPTETRPMLSSRVLPLDIDQVYAGQSVRVRFDGFDQQTTPEIAGEVVRISPDRIVDPMTGETYYEVLVAMSEDDIARLDNREIIPGLPATALLSTGERTLLDYLTKPLRTQMFQAFREG